MKVIRTITLLLALSTASLHLIAQQTWSLERCVLYARSHNIQINQQALQARLTKLALKQSQLSQIPNLSSSFGYGYNYGRSIDPTSNQFVNTELAFANASASTSVTLFNWFQRRNTIEAQKYTVRANDKILEKMKNDISLNVANAYLQILLNEAQVNATQQQLNLTHNELQNTIRLVEAGSQPESNRADLEAQYARDSSTYITAKNTLLISILQMKALLNLDMDSSFQPEQPDIEKIPLMNLATITPGDLFQEALHNQPQIAADSLLSLSYASQVKAAKGALYPSLSAYAGIGTNFASTFERPIAENTITVPPTDIGTVTFNGSDYTVKSLPRQVSTPIYGKPTFGSQLSDNLRENIGLSLNIPLFNGWSGRYNVRRAQISLENQKLTNTQDILTLQQDIYQSYANAKAAQDKYYATIQTLKSTQTAYYYAQQRYELGLINSVEYLTNQNNLYQAQINLLLAHYDYIFKMKLLEFYRNLNITLH